MTKNEHREGGYYFVASQVRSYCQLNQRYAVTIDGANKSWKTDTKYDFMTGILAQVIKMVGEISSTG